MTREMGVKTNASYIIHFRKQPEEVLCVAGRGIGQLRNEA